MDEVKNAVDNKIVVLMDDGSEVEYTVIDNTIIQGVGYVLVTDAPDDEDGECYVWKDVSNPEDDEAIYESIMDEKEEEAVFKVFQEQLAGDVDIEF